MKQFINYIKYNVSPMKDLYICIFVVYSTAVLLGEICLNQ
jgi:hypothetical protein